MDEEEHEIDGWKIPDVEGELEAHHADVDMSAADDYADKELDEMKKLWKEMEKEATVNLFGGAAASVDDNNNNYNTHISSHTVSGGGRGYGSSVNGNGTFNNGAVNTLMAQTQSPLGYSSNLSLVWTPKEDDTLKELLNKYASKGFIDCFVRISKELNKSVCDVAMRYKWISDKENGKQRKDDRNPMKRKERKEKVTDSAPRSQVTNKTSCPPFPLAESFRPMDGNDGIPSEAIFGPVRLLTDESTQALSQVWANINTLKLRDNTNLLPQVRNNLISILTDLSKCDMDLTNNMYPSSPFPSKINDELVNKMFLQVQSFIK